jgi:hypothetical protein
VMHNVEDNGVRLIRRRIRYCIPGFSMTRSSGQRADCIERGGSLTTI